jgi:hypothetical protein
MAIKLMNVSNPAAFGVEWTNEGNRFQLVNSRGTASLMFGMQHEDGRWMSTGVVDPERFGMSGPPKNFRAFLAIAESYVNA